jgi:hypothetical protein
VRFPGDSLQFDRRSAAEERLFDFFAVFKAVARIAGGRRPERLSETWTTGFRRSSVRSESGDSGRIVASPQECRTPDSPLLEAFIPNRQREFTSFVNGQGLPDGRGAGPSLPVHVLQRRNVSASIQC